MKTAHPDEGGNTEAAADINRYFDILKKICELISKNPAYWK